MPSTPTRGFIVRPPQSEEPTLDLDNIQEECSLFEYSYDSIAEPIQERIKYKMLEKIEDFLESGQINELTLLTTAYQKFKELHP